MKIGQVIEHNNSNIFFKNHAENEAGRLVSRPLLVFQKNFTLFFFNKQLVY